MNTEASSVTSASVIKGFLKQNSKGRLGVDNDGLSVDESAISAFREHHDKGDEIINFLNDDKKEMTWGRRIALSLMDKKWYNPRAGEEDAPPEAPAVPETATDGRGVSERKGLEKPSLAKAWAYFEHVALDRHIVEPKTTPRTKNIFLRIIHKFQKGDKKLEKSEPGDSSGKTSLYSPVFTPHAQVRCRSDAVFFNVCVSCQLFLTIRVII
jgi:hypothetical protein